MSFPYLPVEIQLMIVGEVFNSLEGIHFVAYDSDRPRHQTLRAQRLAWFRNIAGVCKAWVDSARTVFWTAVSLLTVPELVAFSRAVEDTSAKPACIRRLYFLFPAYFDRSASPLYIESMTEEAQRSFIIVLRRLPVHLDLFRINCDPSYVENHILYRCLEAACLDSTLSVDVTNLVIDFSPGMRDIFAYFAFSRNIVHLTLPVTCGDKFNTPMPSMQLQSLVLQIQFGIARQFITCTASEVTHALRPACFTLQSLTLNLYDHNVTDERTFFEAMKHILSLNGPSTAELNLCSKSTSIFVPFRNSARIRNICQRLACASAFPPFRGLTRLHSDGCGVSPDAFRQLGCSELRQLEMTVTGVEMGTETAGTTTGTVDLMGNGVEMMRDILASLELNELGNLQNLTINFDLVPYPPWVGTKEAWEPLEIACAARNITCVIRHPRVDAIC